MSSRYDTQLDIAARARRGDIKAARELLRLTIEEHDDRGLDLACRHYYQAAMRQRESDLTTDDGRINASYTAMVRAYEAAQEAMRHYDEAQTLGLYDEVRLREHWRHHMEHIIKELNSMVRAMEGQS